MVDLFWPRRLHRTPFTYSSALNSTSIRLLRILPPTGPTPGASQLELEAQTFPIEETPDFIALSCTSCPPEDALGGSRVGDKVPVLLNDGLFHVLPNLFDALRQLRSEWTWTARYLWVNAICINQDDAKERAFQVGVMDRIFAGACQTAAWLGSSNDDTPRVVAILRILRQLHIDELAAPTRLPRRDKPLGAESLKACGLPPIENLEEWAPVLRFIEGRWFRRLWTIHDLAFSKKTVLLWGNAYIDWTHVLAGYIFLHKATSLWKMLESSSERRMLTQGAKEALLGRESIDISDHFSAILELRLACRSANTKEYLSAQANMYLGVSKISTASLLALFAITHHSFEVKDPRDRVYGFLGIANHLATIHGLEVCRLKPDYTPSNTAGAIYEEIVTAVLRQQESLAVLALLKEPPSKRQSGLPSWVPDLARARRGWDRIIAAQPPFDASLFRQTSTGHSQSLCRIEVHRLYARAAYLGRIHVVGPTFEELSDFRRWARYLLERHPTYPFTQESRVEAFWRTLLMNAVGPNHPATFPESESVILFQNWLLYKILLDYQEAIRAGTRLDTYVTLLEPVFDLWTPEAAAHIHPFNAVIKICEGLTTAKQNRVLGTGIGKMTAVEREIDTTVRAEHAAFEEALRQSMPGRRFAMADNGYMILAPEWAELGDSIVIVKGCPCPIVARLDDEAEDPPTWTIVGSAYVHGVMHGEAISENMSWQDMCFT
jgi:hypothetical protein